MAGLPELLAVDLLGTLSDSDHSVVLWLDPSREFQRLWPIVNGVVVERGAVALSCDPEGGESQLELKLRLLELESSERSPVIVYLPGFDIADLQPRQDGGAPELWSVYEYRYKGSIWALDAGEPGELPAPPGLPEWLESKGVAFVDDRILERLVEGGRDSLLARYVEHRVTATPSEWPRPLRESDVVGSLGGDPREALRDLVASPRNTMRLWGDETRLTLDGIRDRFGLEVLRGVEDPQEITDAFLVQLALTEAWEAFGRPDDFPFRARLPTREDQRERAARFLGEDILQDIELGPRYRERMLRLEYDYDLTSWSSGRAGQPRGLPRLARNRFREFLVGFDEQAVADWKGAASFLIDEREVIEAARTTTWDGVEGETQWSVLADAAELRGRAERAVAEVQHPASTEDLFAAYSERWFEVDRLHLEVRAACARTSGLEQVRRVADLSYFEYAEAVNSRLASAIEGSGWPSAGTDVSDLATQLWTAGGGRRGVIVVDALRWDLAQTLSRAMPVEVEPVIATVPSTTPFGMTALLPLEDTELAISFDRGVSIRTGSGTELATRSGRKSFLESKLSKSGVRLAFLDLDEVLQGAEIPPSERIVVFDNTIDEQGHKGTEEFPLLVEQLVGKLRRAIERLHEAGLPEVHVVTDHGFLLLPADMVNGLGRPAVKANQALRREARWVALKPGAPVTGLINFKLPLGKQEIELGFPRGVRTLVASENFAHGGISVQESVIPHIVSRSALGPVRTDVEVDVVTRELTGGTIAVVLRGSQVGQGTLGDVVPAQVMVWVESRGAKVSDDIPVEVRPDAVELKPPLYLHEGAGLSAGTELVLRAIDRETGQELASIALELKVDWE